MSDETWLSDYLLGEGTDAQRAEAERRLAADPALRVRAQQLGDVTDRLKALPGLAWQGLELPSELGEPPGRRRARPDSDRPGVSRRRWRASPALAAVALAIVFAAGIGLGALIWSGSSGPRATVEHTVTLTALPGSAPQARGTAILTSDGHLRLSVAGLPPTAAGHFYEAWLMTSTTRLVAIATFRVTPGGHATMTVMLPAAATAYRYIDISAQSAGAGPDHSGDSVLRGPTRT